LKIIVCVKQVPATQAVQMDPETGTLIRPKEGNKMNPYDLYAVKAALDLMALHGGEATALSMGPAGAREVLLECVYMGIPKAALITDRRFGGADCLATSYTLAGAVKLLGGADLVLCGKQTTDGDTAQVGAELSEQLGYNYEANVFRIKAHGEDRRVEVGVNRGTYILTESLPMPCVLSVDDTINVPGLPSYKRKKALTGDPITVFTLDDYLDQNENNYGLSGSATQVEKIFIPTRDSVHETLTGTPEDLAAAVCGRLAERKAF